MAGDWGAQLANEVQPGQAGLNRTTCSQIKQFLILMYFSGLILKMLRLLQTVWSKWPRHRLRSSNVKNFVKTEI